MLRTSLRPTLGSRNILVGTLLLALAAAGCSADQSPGNGSSEGGPGSGTVSGSSSGPVSGSSSGPVSGSSSGGSGDDSGGGLPAPPDAGGGAPNDAGSGTTPDASTPARDAGSPLADGGWITPMGSDSGSQPTYAGEIPIDYGPAVPPAVTMKCAADPTQGYTEYKDTFHVEYPYTLPLNTRFSIIGGIYTFWVFSGDPAHSPTANGTSPRTEAAYGAFHDALNVPNSTGNNAGIGYFTATSPDPKRIYSADMLLESNATGSIIFQLHTESTGVGPVYLFLSGGDLKNGSSGAKIVIPGSTLPGGTMADTWFNLKVAFDASKAGNGADLYVNNCLIASGVDSSNGSGALAGRYYFKNGVYHCSTSGGNGCNTHYKNVHLYSQ